VGDDGKPRCLIGGVEFVLRRGRGLAGDDGGFGRRRGACYEVFFDQNKSSVATARREGKRKTREEGGDAQPSHLPMKFSDSLLVLWREISP
jgi:hypothetical protein